MYEGRVIRAQATVYYWVQCFPRMNENSAKLPSTLSFFSHIKEMLRKQHGVVPLTTYTLGKPPSCTGEFPRVTVLYWLLLTMNIYLHVQWMG